MNTIKENMIAEAKKRYNKIFPCSMHANFDECFTVVGNKVVFWFNTEDLSTHVITTELAG